MIVKATIGAIEFSGDEVRIAVVRTGGRLPQILELQTRQAEYEDAEDRFSALVQALDEALDALRTHPTTYVLCLPCTLTIVRALTIPFKGQSRVEKAVPFELEPHLAFPLEELLLDFNVIAEVEGTTEVLAVGARRKHLEEQLAILEAAGVEPEMAGVDVAGMTTLWQATQKSAKGLRAVLHVRADSSSLAVMHNNALAYYRPLYFGAEQLTGNPVGAAREVQNTLRAFMAKWRCGGEITMLAVTGPELRTDEIEQFEDTLGMPVEATSLVRRMKGAQTALDAISCAGEENRWEAVVGVAFSAAGGGLSLNLMKDAQQIHGAVRSVVAHLMFSACLALLFLLGCAWYYHEGRLRNETVIEQVRQEIDLLEEEIVAMEAEGLGEDIEFTVFGEPTILDLIKEIAARMPDSKVTINEIRVAQPGARGGWLDITGSTASSADFNAAFEELKKTGMFKLAEDTNIRLQGERTTFRIRAFRPEEEIDEAQS